jgi:hypothetical protein
MKKIARRAATGKWIRRVESKSPSGFVGRMILANLSQRVISGRAPSRWLREAAMLVQS